MEQQHKRSAFSGKIGFVLSAAGASVGLGNIWRFPYLAAKYGGGIFLLVYILLAVTFGYTMIVAETALGRMTHKSPVSAYAHFGKGRGIRFGGWINAIIPILIVPYYSVIGGWVIHYLAEYLCGRGGNLAAALRDILGRDNPDIDGSVREDLSRLSRHYIKDVEALDSLVDRLSADPRLL